MANVGIKKMRLNYKH